MNFLTQVFKAHFECKFTYFLYNLSLEEYPLNGQTLLKKTYNGTETGSVPFYFFFFFFFYPPPPPPPPSPPPPPPPLFDGIWKVKTAFCVRGRGIFNKKIACWKLRFKCVEEEDVEEEEEEEGEKIDYLLEIADNKQSRKLLSIRKLTTI
uniref:Uncharacterized protein n=1 Tax=Cacopsylla melanoneura TaxID=428564 RepID=A0A8D8ZBE7_9HEMI